MSYQQLQEHVRRLSGYDKVIAEALTICAMAVQAQVENKTFPTLHEDGVWVVFIHDQSELISLIKQFRISVETECEFDSKRLKTMFWTLSEQMIDATHKDYCDQHVTSWCSDR